jgi:hypothetical protein
MIKDSLRMVCAALTDATTGVNARLAAIPLEAGDTALDALALIAEESTNPVAARGQLPDDDASFPCLLVGVGDEGLVLDPHQKTGVRDGTINLLVRYAARQVASATGTQQGYDTLRAVERCLTAWINLDPNVTTRTANNITLWFGEQNRIVPLWAPADDKVITGGLLLAYRVRDTAP